MTKTRIPKAGHPAPLTLKKGLFAFEWAMIAYMGLTLGVMLFGASELSGAGEMISGRVRVLATTLALWGIYRLVPSRWTLMARVVGQMALLSWWYPDTYALNSLFPSLDHVFASWEQAVCGCQPALLFSRALPQWWAGELMCLGYAAYYPMIAAVMFFYLFWHRGRDLAKAAWVVLASFFAYYTIYIFVPVAGPQYYYPAAGLDQIAAGVFPQMGHWFATHTACLPTPGWDGGLFHQAVAAAHAAGERPTAAFPSSHVGVSTVVMLLALRTRCRWLTAVLAPLYVLLCLSTVYILAHYAVDVVAGWITGVAFYFALINLKVDK